MDVHVLTLPQDRADWREKCLASLASEPVTVHVLAGYKNQIGKGRLEGFMQGTDPYVSFVDPDDWVLPGGFAAGAAILDSHPEIAVVATAEYRVGITGVLSDRHHAVVVPHHLLIFRRKAIVPFYRDLAQQDVLPEPWLVQQLGEEQCWQLEDPYYVWRIHDQGWHLRERKRVVAAQRALRRLP